MANLYGFKIKLILYNKNSIDYYIILTLIKKGKRKIEEAKLENKKYWIWLSMLREIGNISKNKLLDKYKMHNRIYNLTYEELKK